MKVYTGSEITKFVFDWLWAISHTLYRTVELSLSDSKYVLPTGSSVNTEFTEDLFRFLVTTGMWREYEINRLDCDNFALIANAIAQIKHSLHTYTKNPVKPLDAGICFGQVSFVPKGEPGPFHRANLYITKTDGEIKIMGYEPQTCQSFKFTEKEIISIRKIDI